MILEKRQMREEEGSDEEGNVEEEEMEVIQ